MIHCIFCFCYFLSCIDLGVNKPPAKLGVFVNRTEVWPVFYYIFCLLCYIWMCTVDYSILLKAEDLLAVVKNRHMKLQPVRPLIQPAAGQNRKMYISSKVTTKHVEYMFVLHTVTDSIMGDL